MARAPSLSFNLNRSSDQIKKKVRSGNERRRETERSNKRQKNYSALCARGGGNAQSRTMLSLSLPLRNSSHLCVFVRNECGISEKEGELHADPNYASASGGEITVNAP